MGRLQRKKIDVQKKKKKQNSIQGEPNANNAESDSKKVQLASNKKIAAVAKSDEKRVKIEFLDKTLQFLREVRVELKKVTWPTRKQTMGSTVVVLVLVMIIAAFLGIVDVGLTSIIQLIIK